ncbi:MAG: F0F1 ATP synthase subunit epsilon [Candidatus Marinimicrobia bacterium]|nr:F0F1 ATP synthase subunit epsilon [Candidatus Neomarinimicrobiota bacterium]
MAENFSVEVVTPISIRTYDSVSHVRATGVDGKFGILPRHISAIMALKPGELRIDTDNKQLLLATSGGYCEVQRGKVLFLVETAEIPGEIDVERAQKALDRANERLKEKPADLDHKRVRGAIERANNRLKISARK